MKDLGTLKYFLGTEVLGSRKGIFLRQKKYVLDLLAETGLLDCKPSDTLIMLNHGLKIVEGDESADRERYQCLGTPGYGVLLEKKEGLEIHRYTDDDWAGIPVDRRSIDGLLTEIDFPLAQKCQLFCDNNAAISIAENPIQHDKTKHVEIDLHFIKDKIENGVVELHFVRSEDQLADILTNAFNLRSFNEVMDKLSIGNVIAQLKESVKH